MPPESSSLPNYSEIVDISLAGLNRALSYIGRTIGPSAAELSNSMPVIPKPVLIKNMNYNITNNSSTIPMQADIVLHMVHHFDDQPVSLSRDNSWPWKLSIYCDYFLGMAQSSHILQFYLQNFHVT